MTVTLESKPDARATGAYLRFRDDLEQIAPDEERVFRELSETMQHITRTLAARSRHAHRPVHAKSHGLLVGRLTPRSGLAPALRQGLFADLAAHDVVLRFSTHPGDLLADKVSTPRGLAVKVLGAHGPRVAGHDAPTQDFVGVAADAFPVPDPAAFLGQVKLFEKTLALGEGVKHAVSASARALNRVIGVVGLHSATLEGLGAPAVHILGESFTTVAPIRYGDHVAKIGIAPGSDNLRALVGQGIDLGDDYNALVALVRSFFVKETAVWDVKVQLALDDTSVFSIEDASRRWPTDRSPWQTVATITVPPQESYSDARQVFVDERMSFSPWHALAAHRPLGGIMRARRLAYAEAVAFRIARNARALVEPASASEIPA